VRGPMGLSPEAGTGPSPQARAAAHDRMCSRHPAGSRASVRVCSLRRVRPARHCYPPRKTGRISHQDFVLQPDGTLCCPAGQTLSAHERRREADGSLRVVYGASIRSCRPCPLREQCQWNGSTTAKPRQVSVLLHPLVVGSLPLLWCDWCRRSHRRACMQLLRNQCITIESEPPTTTPPPVTPAPFSRAQRAHSRLSWAERLARNARSPTSGQITIKLFGVPPAFAMFLDVPAIL
jgi:hypothetical protein